MIDPWNTWMEISLWNLKPWRKKEPWRLTCEAITFMISLITTRAWLHSEKDLYKLPCWFLLRQPLINTGPYKH